MRNTDNTWRHWGEKDPYFGVLTNEKYRKSQLSDNKDEFFHSGQTIIDGIITKIEKNFGPLARERALDFGCGVGRLTIPLSKHFGEVVGIDISEGMLKEAKNNSHGFNINYDLSDEYISNACGEFDLIVSYIVLQHLDVARGMRIIDRLLSKARGGCVLHIPIETSYVLGKGPKIIALPYLKEALKKWRKSTAIRDFEEALGGPIMEMNTYPLDAVIGIFHKYGFDNVLSSFEMQDETKTVLLFSMR